VNYIFLWPEIFKFEKMYFSAIALKTFAAHCTVRVLYSIGERMTIVSLTMEKAENLAVCARFQPLCTTELCRLLSSSGHPIEIFKIGIHLEMLYPSF
jgi:hypothetical protein